MMDDSVIGRAERWLMLVLMPLWLFLAVVFATCIGMIAAVDWTFGNIWRVIVWGMRCE